MTLHIHLHLCIDTQQGSLFEVGTVAVFGHILRRSIIGHKQSVVLPLIAQNILHKVFVGRKWHTVDIVERAHQ